MVGLGGEMGKGIVFELTGFAEGVIMRGTSSAR